MANQFRQLPSVGRHLYWYTAIIVLSFGFGIILGASSIPVWVERVQTSHQQALLDESKRVEEQFQLLVKNPSSDVVLQRGTLILDQALPTEIINLSSAVNNQQEDGTVFRDMALEARLMQSLKLQFKSGDLRINGYFAGVYPVDADQSKYGLVIVNNISSDFKQASVLLVDLQKAFQHLTRLDRHPAAIFYKDGRVLAHTKPTLVGSSLMNDTQMGQVGRGLFDSSSYLSEGQRLNLDQKTVQYSVVKAGVSGFAVLMEQQIEPWANSFTSFDLRTPLAMFLLSIAGLFVMITVARQGLNSIMARSAGALAQAPNPAPILASVQTSKQTQASTSMISVTPMQQGITSASDMKSEAGSFVTPKVVQNAIFNVNEARKVLQAEDQAKEKVQQQLRIATTGKDAVEDAKAALARTKTVEEAEKILSAIVSDLTDSPVLYFRYSETFSQFSLAHTLKVDQSSEALQEGIFVRPDIQASVVSLAAEGKSASLTNYAPIQKIMIEALNTAHFEAWAVATGPEMNKDGAQLVGLMVIQYSSFKTTQEKPALAKIFRMAANSIYGLQNKIQLKSRTSAKSL